jgi:twitching motility protein PilT
LDLDKLLQQAVRAGAVEVRFMTGRRITLRTPTGEREVQGPLQTAEDIRAMIEASAPEAARRGLAGGRADWTWQLAPIGRIQATAWTRGDQVSATFSVSQDGAGAAVETARAPVSAAPPAAAPPVAAPPATAPPRSRGGATGEIEDLLTIMTQMGASDLHMCVGSPPQVRHDGTIKALPGRSVLTPADTERILFPMAPERNRREFEERNDTDFAYEIPEVARYRCNLYRDRKGVGGVFRVIPSKIMTAEEMGLSKEILQLCHLPKGLVLVTGPTGSGKSTTLCALIDYINRNRNEHIITIEDPIEFVHENKKCLINQRQVGEHTRSFKDALRAALREDPDIVLVGEMRDLETMAIAIETAETGHLVFGTLHTSSAPSTVDRIIDQFPADRQSQIRVMLSESLKGVISQLLFKKIGGGRVPALEVLICTPPVANLIREAKIFQIPSVIQTGKKHGMMTMADALTELVKRKVVEPQEAYAKALDKAGLLNNLKKNNIDTSWAPADAGGTGTTGPA